MVNTPVATATNSQSSYSFVSDGTGGSYISWEDRRSGGYDIYVQHMSSQGLELWASGGLLVCNATGDQTSPTLVASSGPSVIIAWTDHRSG